jgi:hypothetical protein
MHLRSAIVVGLICLLSHQLRSQESTSPLPPTIAAPEPILRPEPASPSASSVERWDRLSVHESTLHADPPLSGQIDNFPGFTRELLRVQWRGGDPIDLYIVRPEGVVKPPVILYLYGYPGEAVRCLNSGLCTTVTKNGYAAVGFSSMLTGQRYHDVPLKEWFVSDLQHSLVGTTHDVQMVLNYLADRGDFEMTRVGLFGEGSGATIAVLAASVDPRIKALDLLNPWGDWPGWLQSSSLVPDAERADYLKPAFLDSVASLDPVTVLPKLTALPVRLQQNLWDVTKTPAAARQRIAAALPPNAQLVQYKDEQEYFDQVGSKGKMLEWMYANLQTSK